MSTNPALIDYLIAYQDSLIQIDLVKELFMIPDRVKASGRMVDGDHFMIETDSPLYHGKLFVWDDQFFIVKTTERLYDLPSDTKRYKVEGVASNISYDVHENSPLCTPQDLMLLHPGMIANYLDLKSTETTIGIFIANYLFLVYPFGAIIPYLNEEFSASKLEKRISFPLIQDKITVEQVKDKYTNCLSLFGNSPEIISPNITEKTITIPQSITDLRERLVAEHKDALDAGDASVMSDIEKQLIAAYRDYLQGDPSLHFLLKKKYFDVTLKKLFLTQGMTEVFGSPGKFVFIDNPMGNGWKQKDLPAIYNEVRQGSYARAVETADGGVIAKLILRVLQDTRIDSKDCQTTRGEHIHGTKEVLQDFLWNYVVQPDGTALCITDNSIDQFIGKDLVIRTPGYCQETTGFCAKCFGYLYEEIGQKAFAPVANDFARNQTTQSLKAMHGKSHNTINISDLDRYLITV